MNAQHFQSQMNRLAETYGANHFKRERADLIWKLVANISEDDFTRLVSDFIGNLRQAPMPPDFRDGIALIRERTWVKTKDQGTPDQVWTSNPSCTYCRDNGVFLCTHPTKGGKWAFRCHCSRGQSDRRAIPQYKQDHVDDGFRFYEVGRNTG